MKRLTMPRIARFGVLFAALALWALPCFAVGFTYSSSATHECTAAGNCSISASPTAGYLVIADVYSRDSSSSTCPISSVADNGSSGGSTYTKAYCIGGVIGNNTYFIGEWYACVAASSVSTITTTAATGQETFTVIIATWYSYTGTCALDKTSTTIATGTSTTCTATSVTPTSGQAELINGFCAANNEKTLSTDGNYTLRAQIQETDEGATVGAASYIVSSTSGSYAPTITISASELWAGATTSYQATGGAAAVNCTIAVMGAGPCYADSPDAPCHLGLARGLPSRTFGIRDRADQFAHKPRLPWRDNP